MSELDTFNRVRRQLREANSEILGELAVTRGYVTPAQLDEAQRDAETGGVTVIDRLVRRGLLTFDQVLELRDARRRQDLDALAAPAPPPDEVIEAQSDPSRVLGRYVLVAPVGGTVWRAWDGDLRRWVALKRPREAVSEAIRYRLHRDARIAASLRHPNLVVVHDEGEADGRPYIVMDFVQGRPLDASGGLRRVVQILRKVALALAEAHRHGVVHRGIKPDTILVDKHDEPRVVDFGLAHATNLQVELTKPDTTVATPLYTAPEQIQNRAVSALTDVYSMGAVLYQMMTGRPPFAGRTALDVCQRVLTHDPVPPRRVEPDVPPELDAICMKAIEKDPSLRYEGAVEFADDLDRWLQGLPVRARPASLAQRAWKRVRRHPLVAAFCAAIAVSAAATLALTRASMTPSHELALETWAKELSVACAELDRRTHFPMTALEKRYHGGAPAMPAEEALRLVEAACSAVGTEYPRLRAPRAWRGLAHFYAGRGAGEIEAACVEGGDDPFPHLMMARAQLALYVRETDVRADIDVLSAQVVVRPFEQTDRLKQIRDRAAASLDRALSCRVWPRMMIGREYDLYAQAIAAMQRDDLPVAADQFGRARQHDHSMSGAAGFLEALFLFDPASPAWWSACERGWPRAFHFHALAHLKQATRHDLQEAVRLLTTAVQLDGDRIGAYEARALAHLLSGHGDDAVKDASVVVHKTMADPTRGKMLRAGVHFLLGSFEAAVTDLEDVAGKSDDWRPHASLAHAQLELGRLDGAVANYSKALDLGVARGSIAVVRMSRGNAYAELARLRGADGRAYAEKAMRDYDETLKADPQCAPAFSHRGRLHLWLSTIEDIPWRALQAALDDLNACVRIDSKPPYLRNRCAAWLLKAELEEKRNDDPTSSHQKAIDDACAAASGDVSDAYNHLTKARAYVARAGWKSKSADPSPDLTAAVQAFEEMERRRLSGTERKAEAIAVLEKALEVNPNQAQLRAILERLKSD